MRVSIVFVIAVTSSLVLTRSVPAEQVERWDYEKLVKNAPIIVVATLVEAVAADPTLIDKKYRDDFIVMKSTFLVDSAWKGNVGSGERIELIHTQYVSDRSRRIPGFAPIEFRKTISWENEDGDKTQHVAKVKYLLFLTPRAKGSKEYIPVSGLVRPSCSAKLLINPRD